ncbi:histidine phosphatase family protein [Streptosporangium sp. NBC_01495]|uniref:histidine phosphatase family protein n=1 Tax=Streptosporangium sp. NBC_01495 TaxID=2903899 RepID=UPI002E32996A|nr:histidine phosphatase family protein [Streptosporangium sp. NBC_01495]
MTSVTSYVIEADGGSRGNPGPAGYGAVVKDAADGQVLVETAESIGTQTNNVAEYRGLIAGLTSLLALAGDGAKVEVRMDSKLVVEQMAGRWKIKNEGLRPLALEAAALARRLKVTWRWIPREKNKDADRLANEAMDAAAKGRPWTLSASSVTSATSVAGSGAPGGRTSGGGATESGAPGDRGSGSGASGGRVSRSDAPGGRGSGSGASGGRASGRGALSGDSPATRTAPAEDLLLFDTGDLGDRDSDADALGAGDSGGSGGSGGSDGEESGGITAPRRAAGAVTRDRPVETPERATRAERTEQPGEAGQTATATGLGTGWRPATSVATSLYLLRHGETPLSVERRFSGLGDPELTPNGIAQAEAAAAKLAGKPYGIQVIVSSPLRRARATAEIIAARAGLEVLVEEGLRETDFGDWEGHTFTEIQRRWPDELAAWLADPSAAPPGGESFGMAARRVQATGDLLVERYEGKTVLAVSHVTPIKMLLRFALLAPLGALYRMHLDLSALSLIEYYADGPAVVKAFNDTSHLR